MLPNGGQKRARCAAVVAAAASCASCALSRLACSLPPSAHQTAWWDAQDPATWCAGIFYTAFLPRSLSLFPARMGQIRWQRTPRLRDTRSPTYLMRPRCACIATPSTPAEACLRGPQPHLAAPSCGRKWHALLCMLSLPTFAGVEHSTLSHWPAPTRCHLWFAGRGESLQGSVHSRVLRFRFGPPADL